MPVPQEKAMTSGMRGVSVRSHLTVVAGVFLFLAALLSVASGAARSTTDPWTSADTVRPEEFVKELASSKNPPTVLFVGFRRLYAAGHIHGAQFHDSAGSEDGLKELNAWAAKLPRSTSLVIYCGCCPMEHCPNIRPAYLALHELGFTKVRVLLLENTFETDWANKGYPYDKGE
jgi:thiosulfate/3-mercaptopyruvate sulfurtransferase